MLSRLYIFPAVLIQHHATWAVTGWKGCESFDDLTKMMNLDRRTAILGQTNISPRNDTKNRNLLVHSIHVSASARMNPDTVSYMENVYEGLSARGTRVLYLGNLTTHDVHKSYELIHTFCNLDQYGKPQNVSQTRVPHMGPFLALFLQDRGTGDAVYGDPPNCNRLGKCLPSYGLVKDS